MKAKKLTSIRLDEVIIEKADALQAHHTYYKRSEILNDLLLAVLTKFPEDQVYQMMKPWEWKFRKVNTQFEVTDEYCSPKY